MEMQVARGRVEAVGQSHSGRSSIRHAVAARMRGPGGYYNVGNALALGTGIAVQVSGTLGHGSVLLAVREYLVGSPAATALTLAILIFGWSGEMYHRAWVHGFPPDRGLNWWGDFLSGVAALVLTFALAAFGDLRLALASGLLLAIGKFGSALKPEEPAHQGNKWPRLFRWTVLASRGPAIATLLVEIVRLSAAAGDALAGRLVMPVVMLVCYLLWARADLLLMAACPAPRADVGVQSLRAPATDA
jgi:hypothetical protein